MKKLLSYLSELSPSSVMAFAAVIISLCALIVSIQEMRINREQHKATMFPYLTVGRYYNAEGFGVRLKNSGSGLAKINAVELTDGERSYKNWGEVITTHLPDSLQFGYESYSSNQVVDEIITPTETVDLFFVHWTPAARLLEERTRNLRFKICYSSLLDDHWVLYKGKRLKQDSCEPVKDQAFK